MLLQSTGGSGWLTDTAMCRVHDAASGTLAPIPGAAASSSWAAPPSQAFGPVTSAVPGWHPACRLAWSPSVPVPSAWRFLKQLPCWVPADGYRQKLSPSREAKELLVPRGHCASREEPRHEGAESVRAVRGSQTTWGERVLLDLLPPAFRAAPELGEECRALSTGVLPSRRGQGVGEAQPVLLASSNAQPVLLPSSGPVLAPGQGGTRCPGAPQGLSALPALPQGVGSPGQRRLGSSSPCPQPGADILHEDCRLLWSRAWRRLLDPFCPWLWGDVGPASPLQRPTVCHRACEHRPQSLFHPLGFGTGHPYISHLSVPEPQPGLVEADQRIQNR